MNARETAWRMFSKEFNDSTLDITSGEEKAPSYVVTPLGAKANRLFIVGVVTDIDEIGSGENPMIRAKVADPAGSYYLSAGQFQLEAMNALKELKPPEFIAVVGKAKVYAPDDTVRLLSIRPEVVEKCDAALRDYWVYETAVSTMRRVGAMEEALKMEPPSVQELEKLGYPRYLSEGVTAAANHYKQVDLDSFRSIVGTALKEILSSGIGGVKELDVEETVISPNAEQVEVVSKEGVVSEDEEQKVLQLVKSLDKDGKGAKWDDIVVAAKKKKIEKDRLEEVCTDLMDKGDIYEPELGRIKLI